MEVHLTPDQEAFVKQGLETGRFQHPEEAIQEALQQWEERERTRAQLLLAIDSAEASLARGDGRTITPESMRQVANEVKRRGRTRLAPEQEIDH